MTNKNIETKKEKCIRCNGTGEVEVDKYGWTKEEKKMYKEKLKRDDF